jgi:hypothetical protein
MTATAAPFGVRAVSSTTGTPRTVAVPGGITSAYGTALYTGTPVIVSSGVLAVSAGTSWDGVFQGCEYTDASGSYHIDAFWPAGQTIAANTQVIAYVHPASAGVIFEVQSTGSVAQSAMGTKYDFVINGGSNLSGQSTDAAAAGTGAAAQIVGFGQELGNAPGDAYTIIRVENAAQSKLA